MKGKLPISRGSYSTYLFISILFLSLIPSLMISLLYSRQTMNQARLEMEESNTLYLGLISNALDIVIANVLDFSDLLAVDPSFKNYVEISDKDFLDRFTDRPGQFGQSDLKRLYEYYDLRSEIYTTLDTLTLSNEFIHSLYFFDPSQRVVFKNGTLPVPVDSFHDRGWIQYLKEDVLLPYIMPLKIVRNEMEGAGVPVISILTRSPDSGIPFVLNLDARILYDRIIEAVPWDPADCFFILSSEREPLLYSMEKTSTVMQLSLHADEIGEGEARELVLGSERYQVCSRRIDPMGWTVYSISDPDRYLSRLRALRFRLFLLSMFLFPLFTLGALLAGRRLYSPIRNLSGLARSILSEEELNESSRESSELVNELGLIRYSLISMDRREHELERDLDRSLPAFRREFFDRLLTGGILSEEDISEGLIASHSPLRDARSALMMISPGESDFLSPGRGILIHRLEEEFSHQEKLSLSAEILEVGHGFVCIIVNIPAEGLSSLHDFFKSLMESLNREDGIFLTAAVSSVSECLRDLDGCYKEALNILRLRSLSETGQLLFYDDLKLGQESSYSYSPGPRGILLADSIKKGRERDARKSLAEIRRDILTLKERLNFRKVRRLYITLLDDMYRAVDELGLDGETFTGECFVDILESRSLEELHRRASDIAGELARGVGRMAADKHDRRVDQVIRVVEESCGQDINLNTVADRIGLNPSYVSRLFREQMKISFIDYLTEVRMTRALNLLKESDRKVGDIAAEVGYLNANYFIRIFKKRTGQTPGEYRKRFR